MKKKLGYLLLTPAVLLFILGMVIETIKTLSSPEGRIAIAILVSFIVGFILVIKADLDET